MYFLKYVFWTIFNTKKAMDCSFNAHLSDYEKVKLIYEEKKTTFKLALNINVQIYSTPRI